jgi:hypothetical protein
MSTRSKTYSLPIDKGVLTLEVSAQEDGNFAASVLYGTLTTHRLLKIPGEPGNMKLQGETRHAATEDEALAEILGWARIEFGKVGSPVLVESTGTNKPL